MKLAPPLARLVLPAALAVLGLSPGVAAQQQEGDVELQFAGSLLSTVGREGGSLTSALIKTKGGYFVTDRVELGAFPGLVYTRVTTEAGWQGIETEQTVSDTRFGLGVFATYSFLAEDATTVPYLGAQLYRIDLTDEDEGGWAGLNAGAKFYLNRSTAFDMGGNLLAGVGDSSGMLLLFQLGLNFLL